MEKHPIESLMQTAMYNIQDMIDVDTIIGEPIESLDGTTIIPISKVCFGFAAGGSDFRDEVVDEYEKEEKNEKLKAKNPFGGGAGAGVKIAPVGLLIVENKANSITRFIPVEHSCAIDKILDYVPDLFKKMENMMNKCVEEVKTKMEANKKEKETLKNEVESEIEKEVERKVEKEIKKKKPKLPKEYEMEEMIDETDGEDL